VSLIIGVSVIFAAGFLLARTDYLTPRAAVSAASHNSFVPPINGHQLGETVNLFFASWSPDWIANCRDVAKAYKTWTVPQSIDTNHYRHSTCNEFINLEQTHAGGITLLGDNGLISGVARFEDGRLIRYGFVATYTVGPPPYDMSNTRFTPWENVFADAKQRFGEPTHVRRIMQNTFGGAQWTVNSAIWKTDTYVLTLKESVDNNLLRSVYVDISTPQEFARMQPQDDGSRQ
jgi:hypothetical protein